MLSFIAAILALAVGAAVLPAAGGALETGWRDFPLAGIPNGASIGSVAAGAGGFAAAGSHMAKADERSGFAVWHSNDGMAWTEVYRLGGDPVLGTSLVATRGGFAAVANACRFPSAPDSGPADTRCEPFALASTDGSRWERAELEVLTGGLSRTSAYVADLAEGPDGTLLAVGWIERIHGERDPAIWRSNDGGKSWAESPALIPSAAGTPDEMTSVRRVVRGWLAAGYDEFERRGGFAGRTPRLWRSADGVAWERVEPPQHASGVDFLTNVRTVTYVSGGAPLGVSIWRADSDGRWTPTDDGFPAGKPRSLWFLEADADGLVLGGLETQANGQNRPVLWGSADGVSYRRTLLFGQPSWVVAAVRFNDRWFVYGYNTTGGERVNRGWVASGGCATGRTCSAVMPEPGDAGFSAGSGPAPPS